MAKGLSPAMAICEPKVKMPRARPSETPESDRADPRSFHGVKHSLCEGGTTVSIRHGQNSLLILRGETKHTHDLGHPGTGDSLLPGNICLVDDLAGLQENLPLNGLPEELYDPGRPGHLGRFQVSLEGR